MKMERIGCCFIYSVALIALGMGLYKYRADVIDFLGAKYHSAVQYIQKEVPPKVENVKEGVKDKLK